MVFQQIYIPYNRLYKYVNATNLPQYLGGTWEYDHQSWVNNRLKVEEFVKQAEKIVIELESLRYRINNLKHGVRSFGKWDDICSLEQKLYNDTKEKTKQTVNAGNLLGEVLEKQHIDQQKHLLPIPQDIIDTKERISRLLDIVQGKMTLVEEAWIAMKKSLQDAQEVHTIEEGVCQVTNWILGPGEMMLNSQQDVGYDVFSAEDLRRNHESLELYCREPYGHYAELLHKLELFTRNGTNFPKDLRSQKDFMDFVCRSFATRVERRRNILITSARFFRLVSETTSAVYENLVMSINIETLESAECTLLELQECQANIDILEKELVKEGEKLSDLLAMPVKDALGRELPINYQGDIINVQEILDMTLSRKQLFRDSVELQKLTLQQVAHIHSYENDAVQAIKWLNELYKVMLKSHCYVGCRVYEIQIQKEDHQCFQDTAKGTFEFGCQLLSAALSLRQSCKLSEDTNVDLTSSVWQSWKQLHTVSQEQLTRLRVSAVFHRNVDQHCQQLKELIEHFCIVEDEKDLSKRHSQLRKILFNREKLLLEVGRMVRLGRLLKSRLREPVCSDCKTEEIYCTNETAIEAVCNKLSKVTLFAQKLDTALCNSQYAIESKNITKILSNSSGNASKAWYTNVNKSNNTKLCIEESNQSDDDFHTASECTGTSPSRISSFQTASEGELSSPWWEVDPSPSDTDHEIHLTNNPASPDQEVQRNIQEAEILEVTETIPNCSEYCEESALSEDKSINLHATYQSCQLPDNDEIFEHNEDGLSSHAETNTNNLPSLKHSGVVVCSLANNVCYNEHIMRQAITGIF